MDREYQMGASIERMFPSPTHGPTACNLRTGAERPYGQSPSEARASLVRTRNMRVPLWIEVKYRGGSEAWWEIRFRGQVRRYPGHLSLHELGVIVNGGGS